MEGMMRLEKTVSWQIAADFPEELQFAGYIAQQADFRLGEVINAQSPAEIEWRAWWDDLINSRLDVSDALSKLVDPRPFLKYDPPNFNIFEKVPALQMLCRQHWFEFDRQWGFVGGKKEPTTKQLIKQINQLRCDKIVKECVKEMGKIDCRPFHLQVDFVLWPKNYQNHVSNQHIILGAQFIQPPYVDELITILRAIICSLV